ncbi:MAG: phosphoribosylformimino-5-aminoimidazole carboxamide ribotide isomerase [Chloroflexi bacterium]|nr:phosphoribosylformimino-5-aminoimidazole carboxamide ribotide isomerase [Chloroflexota bacterium]MDA1147046.1 phosphoribosylformimino-5-aminoimidazole carboxamide ribotide isomerase [Chloroflexota bacterium]
MRFRPCIDLHDGAVKQIVGATLTESADHLETNFEAEHPPEWFAERYRQDRLPGGHVIQLGSGNERAARAALAAWPGGMQLGGGVTLDNAADWLEAGASHVIVTSWVFQGGVIRTDRLEALRAAVGRDRVVLDLSCRKRGDEYLVATNRWQQLTTEAVTHALLVRLAEYCSEFLIHAVDVEGLVAGIDADLVAILGSWDGLPLTYAGGIRSADDIAQIETLGHGRIDFTVGSALDIFGGTALRYADLASRYRAD